MKLAVAIKSMKRTLLWLWCFPQNLLGWLVKMFTGAEKIGDHYRYKIKSGSVSLGEYIFLCPGHWGDEETLAHEKGHREQSRRLGWFYLIVVGIPSVIWCVCFEEYRKKHNIDYSDFYTEKWADKLGGVVRR